MNSSIFSKNRGLPRDLSGIALATSEAKRRGGFTLIELAVAMAIAITMITSLVIQQSRWNDRLTVNTQTYELALMIRQAQIYSLGVREYTDGVGDKFDVGYGIHINMANPNQYIFFADKDKDLIYDAGEELSSETKSFTRGVTLKSICGKNPAIRFCYPAGSITQLDISFFRPEPKANAKFLNSAGNVVAPFILPGEIFLQSVGGKESSIKIESNGQISIIQ